MIIVEILSLILVAGFLIGIIKIFKRIIKIGNLPTSKIKSAPIGDDIEIIGEGDSLNLIESPFLLPDCVNYIVKISYQSKRNKNWRKIKEYCHEPYLLVSDDSINFVAVDLKNCVFDHVEETNFILSKDGIHRTTNLLKSYKTEERVKLKDGKLTIIEESVFSFIKNKVKINLDSGIEKGYSFAFDVTQFYPNEKIYLLGSSHEKNQFDINKKLLERYKINFVMSSPQLSSELINVNKVMLAIGDEDATRKRMLKSSYLAIFTMILLTIAVILSLSQYFVLWS